MKDVVQKEGGRSIRNISVPSNRKHESAGHEPVKRMRQDDSEREPKRRKGSRFIWVIAIIALAVLGSVGASIIFKKATISITPKSQKVALPPAITAYLDAPTGELQFQTITTTNVGNRTVPASGEAHVEKRSTGTITVYNEYSTAVQRLIKNTRFEAPDGKIYRIDQSIVVPGATKKSDGTLTAGTIDVVVSADSAGDTYNRGLDTYTIPGFKGDPRYTKFYAKGKTQIAGGFVGTQKIVADADLSAAKTGIQTELALSLQSALESATPAGYLLVPQSSSVAYEELPRGGDSSAAVISLRGTAQAAIVRQADLATAVARASGVEGYAGEALRFADTKSLALSAKASVGSAVKTLPIGLSGDTTLVWEVDGEAIKRAVLGAKTTELLPILLKFKPAVSDATAKLRPVWESSFPEDPALIEVTVVDPS